jgi:GT2 family glycosyltransferase
MAEATVKEFSSDGRHVDVAIVVVSFRSATVIDDLIESVRRSEGSLKVSLTVVDNSSDDSTCEVVARHCDVNLIRSKINSGYASGVNVGFAKSPPCDAVLVLNPDLKVRPDTIRRLYEGISGSSSVGVAVPLLEGLDGGLSLSLRREPTVLRTVGDSILGARWRNRPPSLGEIVYEHAAYQLPSEVDWATGAAFCISSECMNDVGEWDDELFFLYSEETDFCRRARARGWTIELVPSARALHSGGGSGTSPVLDAVLTRSRIRYMKKHHGRLSAVLTWSLLVLGHLLRIRRSGGLERLRMLCQPIPYWRFIGRRLGGAARGNGGGPSWRN